MIAVNKGLKVDSKELKKEYETALRNSEFKLLVNKLKLSDNELMKYTSSLEDSSKEFDNCLNCKSLNDCSNEILGHTYLPKVMNNKLNFHYKPCRYFAKQEKISKHLKNVHYYNLPLAIKEASWDKVDKSLIKRKETINWLNKFMKNPTSKGLYLHGSFGSGKSYLITAMFNELAKQGIKSAIVFWPEFLQDLKASFNTDYDNKLDYVKKVELLLIDDIGAESSTSWSRDEVLCSILQYRMDEKLATFFTSNLDLESLTTHFSETRDGTEIIKAKRIIERIKYLTDYLQMVSDNLRK